MYSQLYYTSVHQHVYSQLYYTSVHWFIVHLVSLVS